MFGLKVGSSVVFGFTNDSIRLHLHSSKVKESVYIAGEMISKIEEGVVFYGYTDYSLYLDRLTPNEGEGDWRNGREPDVKIVCKTGQPARVYSWCGGWELIDEDDGITVVTHEEFSDVAEMASIGEIFKKEVVA
ncbi:MAG: hypothetical protein EOM23_09150 [Candidatus Moranbacteria bacterium]|nr:hypothetical protein [Candidatus Moranbacteria bacterium]